MIKILNLGTHIESTGEVRVTMIDSNLVKTASNDIQRFWDGLSREPDKAYLHVIAMTALEWYSCNNNGDAFTEEDLRKYHPSFINDANIFLHHDNKDPKKSHGKVIYSFYNEAMHRVELVLALDKVKAPGIVQSIKNDEPIAVSMGVRVKFDKCSICGNEAKTRAEYCNCLRYNMKKILEDGRQVYAINPGPLKFFDISIVSRPADKTAWALQKVAQLGGSQEKTSAELGEEYEATLEKVAAITKFSEMLKELDAIPTKMRDGDDRYRVQRALRDQAIQAEGKIDFSMPGLSFAEMRDSNVSPGALIGSVLGAGAPLSLSEIAFAAGKHHMGDEFKEHHMPMLFSSLGPCLKILKSRPGIMNGLISDIINDLDQPDGVQVTLRIEPLAKKRRSMLLGMAGPAWIEEHEKTAGEALRTIHVSEPEAVRGYERKRARDPFTVAVENRFHIPTSGPALAKELTVKGSDGELYSTYRNSVLAAKRSEALPSMVKGLAGAGLAMAALGSAVSDSSLSSKLIVTPILAALSMGVSGIGTKATTIETIEGMEVPASTLFTRVKEAASVPSSFDPKYVAPMMGAAVPSMLALDYVYNKHIKHRKNPYYREGLGKPEAALDYIGDKALSRPLTSLGVGAIGASALRAVLKKKGLI
jgi:hypothetical protein